MKPKKPHATAESSGAVARATARTSDGVPIMDAATSSTTGVDTLTVSNDLQQAGFSQPQANALARWFGKLATKEDLHRVETHLNAKLDKLNDKIDKNVYILLGGMAALIGIMTTLQKLLP